MSNLSSLPNELIDMMSTYLSNADVLNLKSQSRTLRNGTTFQFCERFINKPLSVTGSHASFQTLANILSNPDFSSAKALPQALLVHDPNESDMPPGTENVLPTTKGIHSLLAELPRLQTLTIIGDSTHRDNKHAVTALRMSLENLAPVLLKSLVSEGCPYFPLSKLDLKACYIDGALLVKVLLTYKHSLHRVSFKLIDLRDYTYIRAVRWREIFEVVLQDLDIEGLVLDKLMDPDAKRSVVLCKESMNNNSYYCPWGTRVGERRREEDVETPGDAIFSRYCAHLTLSVYVRLGLERLLGRQGLTLYHV